MISALAAVAGSLVGGTATVATTWVTQRTQSKRQLIRAEMKKREALYGEFIHECSKRAIDSFERMLDKPESLLSMYELINRIRLCASDTVLQEAEAGSSGSSWSNTLPRTFRLKRCANWCAKVAMLIHSGLLPRLAVPS